MKNEIKMFLSSGGTMEQAIKKLIKPVEKKENYQKKVCANNIWSNTFEESIPIYQIYHHVHQFMDECKIENSKAVTKDNKIRKVLFLGYDGMRADMTASLLCSGNEFDPTLSCCSAQYSGIKEVSKNGGLYLAYCGGETGTETQQTTSTSAGWTAQLTGVWGIKNGIKTNEDMKNMHHETFLLEYAKKGLSAALSFSWDPFFDVNLYPEAEYAMKHPDLKLTFCDVDRKKNIKIPKKSTITKEFSDFVAPESGARSVPFDSVTRDYVLHRIHQGDDIICGLYDSIDAMGHMFEFSAKCAEYANAAMTCDNFTYQIMQEIKRREQEFGEEWLVILANDHGGIGKGHSGQSLEERTTWIATNKPIDKALYGSNYNGAVQSK